MNNIITQKINDMIDKEIFTNSKTGTCTHRKSGRSWNSKNGGKNWKAFKKNYPKVYKEIFDTLFDELRGF